jgi:lambda family phage minor tail protein L
MTVPVGALQEIAPGAIIELFELELNAAQHGVNETYRFHAGVNADDNQSIVWAGEEYLRFPIEAEGFEYNGQGQLPRPKLRVSNIFGTITALLLPLPSGIEGAKVTRIRTLARYIDGVNFPGGTNPYGAPDPTAEFPREVFNIDRKAVETRDVIEFELAAVFDLIGVRAPKRQCVSNICQWEYRGPECGYTGNAYFNTNDQPVPTLAQDACGKQLSSCELRFAQLRREGSVTTGSDVLTLTQATNFNTNDPVTGFGLPAGTTVSGVTGNQVTLNQNAVASTTGSSTGTIQSNLSQIVVSSATGLAAGMTVTGNYLQPNTQTTAVSGTTISISPPVDPMQFLTPATTALGIFNPFTFLSKSGSGNEIFVLGTPSVSVGQYVSSSLMPLSKRARVIALKFVFIYRVIVIDQTFTNKPNSLTLWTFYNLGSIPSASYNFAATNQTYTFRGDNAIPYGSFPGVGTFAT